MRSAACYLIKNSVEFLPITEIERVPALVRGIYVLFHEQAKTAKNVVYIGMARGAKQGVKARLKTHSREKKDLWTHFSVFEVWDNITSEQVEELEGLFRHIFRFDTAANSLAKQRTYKPLNRIRATTMKKWIC